jgi:hypothetical protein
LVDLRGLRLMDAGTGELLDQLTDHVLGVTEKHPRTV